MRRAGFLLAVVVLAAVVLAAGCASTGGSTTTTSRDATTTTELGGELLVGGASSLTDAFTTIGELFEAEHAGVRVELTFDSSASLAHFIGEHGPVEVFVAADGLSMVGIAERGLVERGPIVARNQLVIVAPPGNPDDVRELADLADLDVVALCAEDAPCGRLAADGLDRAGVVLDESQVTRGQNARATLGAVADGDADAAIVYVTDARSAGGAVLPIEIPADENAVTEYPSAVLVDSDDRALAEAFVAYLTGPDAQAVLRDQGFLAP